MSMQGPVLSDKEFYDALDYSIPTLADIEPLAKRGDYKAAGEKFCEFIKSYLDPDKYYQLPGKVKKPELTNELLKAAKNALEHNMVSVGTYMKFDGEVDWCANPTYNKYAEWTWQLSRHAEITNLANAYRATGEEKYAEGAVELLMSWIRQAIPPALTESGYHTLLWRTIECGIRMFGWPNIILSILHSPAFTPEVAVAVFKSLYEHAVQIIHRHTANNWLLMEINGLTHIALVYPVFKERGEWLAFVTEKAQKEIKAQVHPDGLQFELTTGYQGVVITNFMMLAEVAKHYGSPLPKSFFAALEPLVEAYIKLMQADGKLPNINDGSHSSAAFHVKRYAYQYPDNQHFKWLLSEGKEGEAPDYLSCLLEYSGLAVMRSQWGKDGVSVLFDAGKFGKGHQHEDKLNVTICDGNKTILCEAQSYAYDTSDMRKYVLSSFGHNTVTVNGKGQARRPQYKWLPEMIDTPEDITYLFTDKVDFLKGSYNENYGSSRPASHERSVIFFKAPKMGRPFTAVIDRLTPVESPENTYEAMWHFDTDEMTLTDFGAKAHEITVFTFGEEEKVIVKGQTEPRVQGYICRSTIQGDYEPIPTLLCRASGKEVTLAALFSLNVDGICPIASATFDNGVFTVTYTNGEVDTVSESELLRHSKNAKDS